MQDEGKKKRATLGSRLFLTARILLTAGLTYYIVNRVGPGLLLHAFTHLHIPSFAGAELVLAGALFVASVRWGVLLAGQGLRHPVLALLRLNFVASFYNVVLPGQETGNAVKAVMLGQSSGQASGVWASVVVDQLTLFIGLLLTGLGGLAAYAGMPGQSGWLLAIGALLTAVCGLTVLMVSGVLQTPVARASARLRWGRREWLYPFWAGVSSYRHAPGHLLTALGLAVAYQLVVDTAIFILAWSQGLDVGYSTWIWILCAVYLAQSLPFTVAGLGVREATLVYFLAPLGVPGAQAVALSFTIVIMYYVFAAPGAILQFVSGRRA